MYKNMYKAFLNKEYVFILIILIMFFMALNVLYNMETTSGEYAKIINISGKQRMLSQRLVILSNNYYLEKDQSSKIEFQNALKEIRRAHKYLLTKIFTPQLQSLYFKEGLDKNLKNYLSNFDKLLETNDISYIDEARESSTAILIQLNKAVKEYEIYVNSQIESINKYKSYIFVGILLILLVFVILFLKLKKQNEINNRLAKDIQDINKDLEDEVLKRTQQLKDEYKRTTDILNSQANFIILTNGKKLNQANKTMLTFFGYKTLDDFLQDYECICDLFIKDDGYLQKEQDGKSWVDIVLEDLNITHQVKMKDLKDNNHIFQISATGKKINKNYTISFMDITEQIKKDEQLAQQSKLAAMGEMIGNIAHQWRQPLSVISTGVTGMQVQKECGILTDEQFIKSCKTINKYTQYLSKTIDDFQSFIKGDRKLETFSLKENINSFLLLIEGTITNNHINLILDLQEDIKCEGYPNELIQCFINIINNAKDILKELDEENRLIFITTALQDNKMIIKFKDSGGGIPDDIIHKIFEPYFTTKHKSQGTGLGLNMTYKMIIEGMGGNIEARNVSYEYEEREFKGAEFVISLPLKVNKLVPI